MNGITSQTYQSAQPAMRSCSWELNSPAKGQLYLKLSGDWRAEKQRPPISAVAGKIDQASDNHRLKFDLAEVGSWDSTLVAFLFGIISVCRKQGIQPDIDSLPKGVGRLIALAAAVPARQDSSKDKDKAGFFLRVGQLSDSSFQNVLAYLNFLGETVLSLLRLLIGKARTPASETKLIIQDCGPASLPIVSLISVLFGLILAYIGAIQLEKFGASIYVANLVGLAMTREMGAVMAGIIMSGRTGAAFAAQLGTMQVNEEIDALETLGISPSEFLVLPRMIALILMMPLLTLYSNLIGILGGMIVAVGALDIPAALYIEQVRDAVGLPDLMLGLVKSVVFGFLVGFTGCFQGIKCGRSASAVGKAVTAAVVSGIVAIVVADAIFAVLSNILGI